MKTAMQVLIDYSENILRDSTINAPLILKKAKELLETEKKQIVDAHIAGQKFASDNHNPDSEEYYSQTFTNP